MSTLETNLIQPSTGTSLTLGASGDTITIPSGVTITNNGTQTGFGGDNLPIFAVSKSGGSNQTINHGSATKVTFSHEITDPSSAFASDKFTVPSGKGGTYLFAWNLQIEDSDSAIVRMSTNLYKNGSAVTSAQMRTEGGDTVFTNFTLTQTRILTASAGDYFEVYVYQESSNGSSVILEASTQHNQYFSGTKLIT
jgi:hypothetical protein|tara:strand:+ start:84 stop:668 length:585 start_codon:yes stop_codon:yes gene_type:complete